METNPVTSPLPIHPHAATRARPDAAAAAAVELRGANRRYGAVEALHGVDLTIERGELTAVLGPNGAGKTTMLSLILGLRQPTSGDVRVLGDAAGSTAARRRVGAMLQESGVPPTLTVAELVALFGSYYPSAREPGDVIAAAGLVGLERRRSRELSGGERQRLLFALALCGDPDLVVLDEPTTGLDVESRRRFWEVITGLAARGTTVLFATHLLDEADHPTHVVAGEPFHRRAVEAGDDGGFEPDWRRASVDDQIDLSAEIGEHMRGRGRRHMAGTIGRRRHHRPAEGA